MASTKIMDGFFAGSPGIVHDIGRIVSVNDFEEYLEEFNSCPLLHLINYASQKIERQDDHVSYKYGDKIVYLPALAYLTLKLLENNVTSKRVIPTEDNLAELCGMYVGIGDPKKEMDPSEAMGMVLRLVFSQFNLQTNYFFSVARTLVIYNDLWHVTNSTFDIKDAIINLCGLTLDEMIVSSYLLLANSARGWFTIPNYGPLEPKARSLLNWMSISMTEFSERSSKFKKATPSEELDKYRFNPLFIKPIIQNEGINSLRDHVIAPIPRLIIDKCTTGLYHELSRPFENQKSNPFRIAFGNVFEKYVDMLTKKSINNYRIYSEIDMQYTVAGKEGKHPDLAISKDNELLLIEVKQSSLFLFAKITGNKSKIENDLSKTVLDGLIQILEFEKNIHKSDELAKFRKYTKIHRLVVTYDDIHLANSLIKNHLHPLLQQKGYEINLYDYHIMTIEEYENLLGIQNLDLFGIFNHKCSDAFYANMDFKNYFFHTVAGRVENLYLVNRQKKFVEQFTAQTKT